MEFQFLVFLSRELDVYNVEITPDFLKMEGVTILTQVDFLKIQQPRVGITSSKYFWWTTPRDIS